MDSGLVINLVSDYIKKVGRPPGHPTSLTVIYRLP
jgi:hypothetical protein